LELLLKREPVPLVEEVAVLAARCFSDKSRNDLNEFISDKTLTRLGAWSLADRANRILNADDNYAHAVPLGEQPSLFGTGHMLLGHRRATGRHMRAA